MCAIGGLMRRPGRQQPLEMRSQLEQMLRVQRHRGPDDEGLWFSADQQTGMCHSRLSILDLSAAGHQPMVSADAQLTIVFNGEIYNHSALRQDLMAQGARFRGHSDTEVLLEAWRHWGVEMLAHLRGALAHSLSPLLLSPSPPHPPPLHRATATTASRGATS